MQATRKIAAALDKGPSALSMYLTGRSPSRYLEAVLPPIAERLAAGASVREAAEFARSIAARVAAGEAVEQVVRAMREAA